MMKSFFFFYWLKNDGKTENIFNKIFLEINENIYALCIAPCTLYGAEILGFKNSGKLETLQLQYLKYSIKLKNGI